MKTTSNRRKYVLVILFVLAIQHPIFGQLTVSNILEYQLGNLPDTEPKSLSTLYDQINLNYKTGFLVLSTKIETFQSADKSKSYAEFVQKSVHLEDNNLGITAGNFYHIIGRGLLLRSYEIPGAVIEDPGLRTRYGFYRDMEGVLAKYTPEIMEVYAFSARPLNNIVPPNFSDDLRRQRLLQGIETRFFVSRWTFSGSYLRDNFQGKYDEYGSVAIETALPFDIQIYSEFAQKFGNGNKALDLSKNTSHAFYLGSSWYYDSFGLSLEYKDYHDFLLGYNDPPPLVKEHEYLLLNRSTHLINPENETGWQSEFFYYPDLDISFNINISESVNDIFNRRYIFQEQFFEAEYNLSDLTTVRAFIDHSRETLMGIENRYTAGVYAETEFSDLWGAYIDLEYQQYDHEETETEMIKNYAVLLSISRAPDLSFGITLEKSNDPGDIAEEKEEDLWLGGNLSYQYSQVHLLSLFLGKRRGGNACTSGICYEILPFEGIELRLTSNL